MPNNQLKTKIATTDNSLKEEIVAGIKNAMERGDSFEKAKQSFLNAGYNEAEVNAAATSVSSGASQIIASKQPSSLAQEKPQSPNQQNQSGQQQSTQQLKPLVVKSPKTKKILIIGLGILIFIMVAVIIGLMFFGKTILETFFG